MREINWRIAAINKRQGREITFNAALHGVKLKQKIDTPKLDEEGLKSLELFEKEIIKKGKHDGRRYKN